MRRRIFLILILATVELSPSAQTAEQCPAGKVPLMVLGTYHMSNPGQDLVNMQADSVSSPRRQKEIAELLERLAKFRPTKIAVEVSRTSKVVRNEYSQYLDGTYKLTDNEIDQIGYALGKRLGLKNIWAVDFPMWTNGLQPSEMHEPKPLPNSARPAAPAQPDEDSAMMKQVRETVKRDEEILKTSSVADYLAYLNTPERARLNYLWDVEAFLRPG